MHEAMAATLDKAVEEIRRIQQDARANGNLTRPRWPMIVLKSPKGWTGPKVVDGLQIEGTFRAHQVPLSDPATHPEHLKLLEEWLRSYRPEELFDESGRLKPELAELAPKGERRMGANPHANGGMLLRDLVMPDFRDYAVNVPSPGAVTAADTHELGVYLRDVTKLNQEQRNFRISRQSSQKRCRHCRHKERNLRRHAHSDEKATQERASIPDAGASEAASVRRVQICRVSGGGERTAASRVHNIPINNELNQHRAQDGNEQNECGTRSEDIYPPHCGRQKTESDEPHDARRGGVLMKLRGAGYHQFRRVLVLRLVAHVFPFPVCCRFTICSFPFRSHSTSGMCAGHTYPHEPHSLQSMRPDASASAISP